MLSVLLICLQIARVAYVNDISGAAGAVAEANYELDFVGTKYSRAVFFSFFGWNIYGISADTH